jgi:hypothetical protein
MKKLAKNILHIAEFLTFTLLLTLEIGLSSFMARIVFECVRCFFAYPSIMMFFQLLAVVFMASMVGVFIFFTLILILMVTGQV